MTFSMSHLINQSKAFYVETSMSASDKVDVAFVMSKAIAIASYDQKYQQEQQAKKLANARSAIQKIMTEQGLTKEQLAQLMSSL